MKLLRAILIPLLILGIELVILYLVFKFIANNWGLPQNPYGGGNSIFLVFVISTYLMLRVIYAIKRDAVENELLLYFFFAVFVCPLIYGVWITMDSLMRDYLPTFMKDLVTLCLLVWPPVGLVLIHVGVTKLIARRETKTATGRQIFVDRKGSS